MTWPCDRRVAQSQGFQDAKTATSRHSPSVPPAGKIHLIQLHHHPATRYRLHRHPRSTSGFAVQQIRRADEACDELVLAGRK